MAAVAHSPELSKRTGVSMDVGSEFMEADKVKKFRTGRASPKAGINKQKTHHGAMQMPNAMLNKYIGRKDGGMMKAVDSKKNPGLAKLPTEVRNKMGYLKKGGMAKEDMKMDKKQDKSMVKKAVGMHDKQQHEGKKTNLTKLAKGGAMHKMPDGKMMKNSAMTKMARGGGIESKGKTKGKIIAMKSGGKC